MAGVEKTRAAPRYLALVPSPPAARTAAPDGPTIIAEVATPATHTRCRLTPIAGSSRSRSGLIVGFMLPGV